MLYVGIVLYLVCLAGTPISILVWIVRALLKKEVRKNTVTAILFFIGLVVGVIMILRSPDLEGEEYISVIDTSETDNDEVSGGNSVDDQEDGDSEEIIFDVSEYPYQNKKDAKKLMKTYKKAMKAPVTDFIGLEEVTEGGIIRKREIHYKKTVDVRKAVYRYYGKTNKKGEPEGIGILFTAWPTEWEESGNNYTSICYIGGFKAGFKNGYGIDYK